MTRNLYIISGCNGKTTASYTILPEMLNCQEFVNTDEIACGISPFSAENASVEAGKIMLHRINHLFQRGSTFAIETNLAAKCYKSTICQAKNYIYNVCLIFFWLQNVELAKQRIMNRVISVGHNVASAIIERRYRSSIINLFDIYLPLADSAFKRRRGEPLIIMQDDQIVSVKL